MSHASTAERLYVDHHGWLHGWLRYRIGCTDTAADLAQDTFLRVVRRAGEAAGVREPRAYLSTIARGLLANHWRRQALEQAYLAALAALPEPRAPSPEDRELALEALHRIDAMLARLPERPRRAFLMAQLDGLTYRAIAGELGVSERMVKKYMARAMYACLLATA